MTLRALPVLLLLASCATTQKPPAPPELPVVAPSPYDDPEIESIRIRAGALLAEQAMLVWNAWSGGETGDLTTGYEGTKELFSPDVLRRLREARDASDGLEKRALSRLALYLGGEGVAERTAHVTLALDEAKNTAVLALDETTRPWRHLDALLAAEASAAIRAKILAGETQTVPTLSELAIERFRQLDDAARAFGWDSRLDYALSLRDTDARTLRTLAESTLEITESLYRETMTELALRELALPLARVRRADVPRLLRSQSTESWFPAKTSIRTATDVVDGLELGFASRQGLTLETGDEPRRRSGPLCVPVSPPDDVRISLRPRSGLFDLRLMLRELSCAAAASSVHARQWELRELVPAVIGETWATLFEAPTRSPLWLTQRGVPTAERSRIVRDGAARRLYAVRLDAARLLFELRDPSADPKTTWRELASRASAFELTETDAERWALEQDAFLESADRLRGTLLAAQLNRHLMERHSALWWTSSQAGAVLETLWTKGGELTPDDIASRLDLGSLDAKSFVSTLEEQMNAP